MTAIRAALAAALLLVGCAGGGGGAHATPSTASAPDLGGVPLGFNQSTPTLPTIAPPGTSTSKSPDGSTQAVFAFTVPATSGTSSISRAPQFVSPNTQSAKITLTTVNGSAPSSAESVTANFTTGSSNCSGSPLVCTVSFNAIAVGSDGFTVTLYSGTNASGSALSTNTVTATISVGSVTTIPLTLEGIIASLNVAVSSSLVAGVAGSDNVVVTAFDASGAQIVGTTSYENGPIVLSTDDALSTITIPTTSFSTPTTASAATFNYSGVVFTSGSEHMVATVGAITAQGAISMSGIVGITSATSGTPIDATYTTGSPNALSMGTDGVATLLLTQTGWGSALGHAFGESDTCSGLATIAMQSSTDLWTITALGTGTCTVTFTGGAGKTTQVAVSIASGGNGGSFQIQSTRRQ